jgi:hypothetical protein
MDLEKIDPEMPVKVPLSFLRTLSEHFEKLSLISERNAKTLQDLVGYLTNIY